MLTSTRFRLPSAPSRTQILCILIVTALALVRLWDPLPLTRMRQVAFDVLNFILPAAEVSPQVTVVDIDEDSLSRVGQWPWPRQALADLTTRLDLHDPRVIGFDIVFPEPDRAFVGTDTLDTTPSDRLDRPAAGDAAFARAIADAPVVLGWGVHSRPISHATDPYTVTAGFLGPDPTPFLPSFPGIVGNLPVLDEAASGHGVTVIAPDGDGVARRLPLFVSANGSPLPHFVLEILRVASDRQSFVIVTDEQAGMRQIRVGERAFRTGSDGAIWLRYPRTLSFTTVSAADVLAGSVAPEDIAGRLVLIGSTASGVADRSATPLGDFLPGVHVIAAAIEGLSAGDYIVRPAESLLIEIGLMIAAALIVVTAFPRLRAVGQGAAAAALVALAFGASLYLFGAQRIFIDLSYACAANLLLMAFLGYTALAKEEALRRRQEEDAARHDAFMRHVAENIFDGLVVTARDGEVLSANRAAARLFGASPMDIVGRRLADILVDGSDGDGPKALILNSLADEGRTSGARRAKALSLAGIETDVEVGVTRLDQDRAPVFVIIVRDITARLRAERKAMQAMKRLADAIACISDGFVLKDPAGAVVIANKQYESMIAAFPEVVPDENRAERGQERRVERRKDLQTRRAVERVLAAGDAYGRYVRWQEGRTGSEPPEISLRDGRWVLARDARTSDGDRVSIFTDVTVLKRREAALVEAAQRIERQAQDLSRFAEELQASRLRAEAAQRQAEAASDAKTDFLAMMSHELRTPLNAVLGYAEMMELGLFGPLGDDRYREYVADIRTSATKLLSIINMILDISKIETDSVEMIQEEIDLRNFVTDCVDMIREEARRKGIALSETMPHHPVRLRTDARVLGIAVNNPLSNAVKFTPAGGRIDIAVDDRAGDTVILSITDTGIGMSDEEVERAMQPFVQIGSQLDRRFEGTGLGLTLAKRASEKLGMSLAIASHPGEGTTVTFAIPAPMVVLENQDRSA